MRHESRESEVLAKRYHKLWKWLSIGSAVIAAANLFVSCGAIAWHSWGEREHQKEIDEWDRAEREVAGEHPQDETVVSLNEVMEDADGESTMFVDPHKVWEKH